MNNIMSQYSGKEWILEEDKLDNVHVWKIEIKSITGKRSLTLATEQQAEANGSGNVSTTAAAQPER